MKRVRIMGILNVTPDSFYDGGNFFNKDAALKRCVEMIAEGADIIDIGGESTRPGAVPVSPQEEIDRVCPVIEALRGCGVTISVDTYRYETALSAVKSGAMMINDISALGSGEAMARLAAESGSELVLMHMRGKPENMQDNTDYSDVAGEVFNFLKKAADSAIKAGVKKENIILDPGIGFGKNVEQNYILINSISILKEAGFPVLIGLSRKSLIGKLYNHDVDRLPGTIALNCASVLNGADIIRVHDVKEHRLAMDAIEKLTGIRG